MDRVYQDRRMLKWLPFEALPEQGHYLKAVFDHFEYLQKPTLSSDHYDYLNQRALEAFHFQETVKVEVYNQGKMVIYEGTITKLDEHQRMMRINGFMVPFDDLINIC